MIILPIVLGTTTVVASVAAYSFAKTTVHAKEIIDNQAKEILELEEKLETAMKELNEKEKALTIEKAMQVVQDNRELITTVVEGLIALHPTGRVALVAKRGVDVFRKINAKTLH